MPLGREGDQRVHPEEIKRIEAEALERSLEAQTARRAYRATLWATGSSTLLGLVSFYPMIRGTRTDNVVMMVIGGIMALIAFKILPVDKLAGLLGAWRGRNGS